MWKYLYFVIVLLTYQGEWTIHKVTGAPSGMIQKWTQHLDLRLAFGGRLQHGRVEISDPRLDSNVFGIDPDLGSPKI